MKDEKNYAYTEMKSRNLLVNKMILAFIDHASRKSLFVRIYAITELILHTIAKCLSKVNPLVIKKGY